ncbi:hypothetical protein [Aureimonas sp. AU40]|uniref:hypothetical protein n=1 Tax=Aureimonas sp. AU40 TaxID=1637747 RepID=UPI000784B9A6|nr:hypothetical protein [Aureimonas sp. AU40]
MSRVVDDTTSAAIIERGPTTIPPMVGGGGIGQHVRDTDWWATLLGAYATWPQSLRSSLLLVLNAKGIAALY